MKFSSIVFFFGFTIHVIYGQTGTGTMGGGGFDCDVDNGYVLDVNGACDCIEGYEEVNGECVVDRCADMNCRDGIIGSKDECIDGECVHTCYPGYGEDSEGICVELDLCGIFNGEPNPCGTSNFASCSSHLDDFTCNCPNGVRQKNAPCRCENSETTCGEGFLRCVDLSYNGFKCECNVGGGFNTPCG